MSAVDRFTLRSHQLILPSSAPQGDSAAGTTAAEEDGPSPSPDTSKEASSEPGAASASQPRRVVRFSAQIVLCRLIGLHAPHVDMRGLPK